MMAVVKSDGYGHGALPIARKLEPRDDIFGFATATAEEALILRRAGIKKPILILGYTFPYAYEELIENDISLTAFKEDMAKEISEAAAKVGKSAKVHIKVDTGMHRIGVAVDEDGLYGLQNAFVSNASILWKESLRILQMPMWWIKPMLTDR